HQRTYQARCVPPRRQQTGPTVSRTGQRRRPGRKGAGPVETARHTRTPIYRSASRQPRPYAGQGYATAPGSRPSHAPPLGYVTFSSRSAGRVFYETFSLEVTAVQDIQVHIVHAALTGENVEKNAVLTVNVFGEKLRLTE